MRRLAITIISLALSVAACSSNAKKGSSAKDSSSNKAASVVLLAAEKTLQNGSSKIAMAADFKAAGQSFSMVGDGSFHYKNQLGAMAFKISGDEIPEAFSGFEIRFIKTTLYMKFPREFSQLAPGLKEWIKADLEELSKQSGFNLPGLNSFAGQDPTSALNFTRAAEDVAEVGPATIRGTATTHYRMNVNLEKALEAFPEEARGGLDQLFKDADLEVLPMELWVDGQGRARRLRFELDLSKFAQAAGASAPAAQGTAAIGIEFYEFGIPVSVSAPPAGQVSDFSEFAQLGAG